MKLNAVERETLEAECQRRVAKITGEGWLMPGVEARLVSELLIELISPIGQANAKERWLFWLADECDKAEAAIRRAHVKQAVAL